MLNSAKRRNFRWLFAFLAGVVVFSMFYFFFLERSGDPTADNEQVSSRTPVDPTSKAISPEVQEEETEPTNNPDWRVGEESTEPRTKKSDEDSSVADPSEHSTVPSEPLRPENGFSSELLTPYRRSALAKFGINPDEITITAEMMKCAERMVGKERVDAIIAGASPTLLEAFRVLGCL